MSGLNDWDRRDGRCFCNLCDRHSGYSRSDRSRRRRGNTSNYWSNRRGSTCSSWDVWDTRRSNLTNFWNDLCNLRGGRVHSGRWCDNWDGWCHLLDYTGTGNSLGSSLRYGRRANSNTSSGRRRTCKRNLRHRKGRRQTRQGRLTADETEIQNVRKAGRFHHKGGV